jgi:hypothetical protein
MSEIYLAGKIDSAELAIPAFSDELEGRGHEIPIKWWEEGRLPRPYLDHPQINRPVADQMIRGAANADIFILFPEEKIMGAMAELGAAILSLNTDPGKEVIIVNPFDMRQSVFYTATGVLAVRSLGVVRSRPWY